MKRKALNLSEKIRQADYCRRLSLKTRLKYDAIGSVFCPALQTEVVFNAKGFHHLRYKPDGTPRKVAERIYKLTLLPLAPSVIKNAHIVEEERDVLLPISRKRTVRKIKAKQYALAALVGKKGTLAVRVIIIKFDNSNNYLFWSIMRH